MVTVAEEQPQLDEPVVAVWAPGSAVLALGEGDTGEQAVAVWQVSPDGPPTGAWVMPCREAFQDRTAARQLLASVERRALTALDPDTLDDILGRLTTAAGVDAHRWWTAQRFSPPDAFEDLLARRAEFEATVASVRQAGKERRPGDVGTHIRHHRSTEDHSGPCSSYRASAILRRHRSSPRR